MRAYCESASGDITPKLTLQVRTQDNLVELIAARDLPHGLPVRSANRWYPIDLAGFVAIGHFGEPGRALRPICLTELDADYRIWAGRFGFGRVVGLSWNRFKAIC